MLTDQLGTKKSCSFNRIRFGVSAHQKGAKKKKKSHLGEYVRIVNVNTVDGFLRFNFILT